MVCVHQYYDDDSSCITCEMFRQLIFYFLDMHNSLYRFIGWYFNNITMQPILEGVIICLYNFKFNNTFVIYVGETNGGPAS